MTSKTEITHSDVAVITAANPPVNARPIPNNVVSKLPQQMLEALRQFRDCWAPVQRSAKPVVVEIHRMALGPDACRSTFDLVERDPDFQSLN